MKVLNENIGQRRSKANEYNEEDKNRKTVKNDEENKGDEEYEKNL